MSTSPNDTIIPAGSTAAIIDANGNVWTLVNNNDGNGYQIAVNGNVDETTRNVDQLAYHGGDIWQQNLSDNWYVKANPGDTWSAPSKIDPVTGLIEPITLTWTGNATPSASDPSSWSPSVIPQPGDVLIMTASATDINASGMNITNNALAGTTLYLGIPPGAQAGLSLDDDSIVNLVLNSNEFLNTTGGTLNFIDNLTGSALLWQGAGQFLHSNLTGNATIDLAGNPTAIEPDETVEFGGSVGSGLTFNVQNAPTLPVVTLRIDDPSTFQATIGLPTATGGLDAVIFEGLQATSGQLHNGSGVLDLFNGNTLIDSVKVTGGTGTGGGVGSLQLQTTSVGTILTQIGESNISGTIIPWT